MMSLWPNISNFSSAFLKRNQKFVWSNTLHHLIALLLYPPNCSCGASCLCGQHRKMIVLSFNLELFERIHQESYSQDEQNTLRALLKVPEDPYFRKNWGQAFPLRQIQQQLKDKEASFKRVDRLIWGFIRLAKTYQALTGLKQASTTETLKVILGPLPLKGQKVAGKKQLGGEKAYIRDFNTYKPISHLIAAFELCKQPPSNPAFLNKTPEQIERLLKCLHWVRSELQTIETPNVKGNSLFSKSPLIPLPAWVFSHPSDISLEPFAAQPIPSKDCERKVVLSVNHN